MNKSIINDFSTKMNSLINSKDIITRRNIDTKIDELVLNYNDENNKLFHNVKNNENSSTGQQSAHKTNWSRVFNEFEKFKPFIENIENADEIPRNKINSARKQSTNE